MSRHAGKLQPTLRRAISSKTAANVYARDLPQPLCPLPFHPLPSTCKRTPNLRQVMGALEAAGYRTSGMHKEPLAVKTDAPDAAVWDVLRCWARDNPQPAPVRAAGLAILRRGTQLIAGADFEAGRAGVETRRGGAAQGKGGFLHTHNPEQDWGPLARRSVMARDEDEEEEKEAIVESLAMSE